MANAPYDLKPGSVLLDNDARNDGRKIVVKAVGERNGKWWVLYQGTHRRHRISVERINLPDGRPHSQGYTLIRA